MNVLLRYSHRLSQARPDRARLGWICQALKCRVQSAAIFFVFMGTLCNQEVCVCMYAWVCMGVCVCTRVCARMCLPLRVRCSTETSFGPLTRDDAAKRPLVAS